MALTSDYNIGYADGKKGARPRYGAQEYMRGYKRGRVSLLPALKGIIAIFKTPRQLQCIYGCRHLTHLEKDLAVCGKAACPRFMDRNRRDGDKRN